MIKLRNLRYLTAAAIPLAITIWFSIPALQPTLIEVEGNTHKGSLCLVTCSEVLGIDSLRLACKHDFSGYPHSCRQSLLTEGPAKVTYVPLPSVATSLGIATTAGVITRIERNGEVVFRKSVSGQVVGALYGGWVFHAIYWPLIIITSRLWPNSWVARSRKRAAKPGEA